VRRIPGKQAIGSIGGPGGLGAGAVQSGCEHDHTMGAREIPKEPDEAFWGPTPRDRRFLSGSVVVNVMIAALAVLIAATLLGLVVLWPVGGAVRSRSLVVSKTQPARVTQVETLRCAVALRRCVS
jgi:hypothetical protein